MASITKEYLHGFVRKNNLKAVENLIQSEVDVNMMYYGWTPLQLAVNQGKQVFMFRHQLHAPGSEMK